MELNSADVVQVAQERKETAPSLEVPNLDLVVIASRAKERLRLVKVDASNRPLVLLVPVQEGAYTEIPELNNTIVKRCKDPWSF